MRVEWTRVIRPRAMTLAGALVVALGIAPHVDAQIFRCMDNNGQVVYTNTTRKFKRCKKLKLPVDIRPTPSPKKISKPSPSKVKVTSRTPGKARALSAKGFPSISSREQKNKDNDRMRILEKELAHEQDSLAKAKIELEEQRAVRNGDERNYQKYLDRINAYQEKVTVHERNISALSEEIGKLR